MDFDAMLEELGEFGRFQIITYILVCLPVLFAAANSLTYVFTAGVPNYRCLVLECDDLKHPSYNTTWLQWAIPHEVSDVEYTYKPVECTRYVRNLTFFNNTCQKDMFLSVNETCKEWVFDGEERTVVNDWNITCLENRWMLSLVGSSHFAGIVVGSAVFGVLADRYGRKLIFIFCIMLMSISGVIQIFSLEYIMFTVFVFINALGTAGVYPLAFIIGVEMVGKKRRELTGITLNYFYAIGEALVALIAWLTRDWVLLQLCVSAPPIIFVVYYWLVPESVRWLLAKQKISQAKEIVYKVAKINKVTLSESLLNFLDINDTSEQVNSKKNETSILPVLKQILKSRKLVVRFAIVFFIWAVNAFVFYGLSVNSTSIGGNKYLNFALVCLIEIPGYSIAWICIRRIGRRWSLVVSLLVCGLTCSVTVFIPTNTQWAVILLFLIGKFGITSAFGVVYVHTSEMLPTVIRSGGVGAASTMARVGALLAPFIPLLGVYVKPLPMLLFGVAALVAGLLALKLPETLGIKLLESVEDAEKL